MLRKVRLESPCGFRAFFVVYPKDFKFVGWHPNCRCYTTFILMTDEELKARRKALLNGEEPPKIKSKNEVTDVPENFKKWLKTNKTRIAKAKSLPYFMKDNSKLVSRIFHKHQPSTNLSDDLKTTIPYISKFSERDARVAAILAELDSGGLSDIEVAMLGNQLKDICANITYADLYQQGLIGDGMIISRLDKGFVVQEKAEYSTRGQLIKINQVKRDMIVLRDKYGRHFAYPVGVDGNTMLISPKTASESFETLPAFLKSGVKRISFYPIDCPVDKYWRVEYNDPNHISAATDGGFMSYWEITKGMSEQRFKEYVIHEEAHALDAPKIAKGIYSSSIEWRNAVNADMKLSREKRGKVKAYPTEYASKNEKEDFAESMKLFLVNRAKLKKIAPNRELYLHELTKNLNRHKR